MASMTTAPAYKYSIVNGFENRRNESTIVRALRRVVTVTATRAPKTLMWVRTTFTPRYPRNEKIRAYPKVFQEFSMKNGMALKISPDRTTYARMNVEPRPYE